MRRRPAVFLLLFLLFGTAYGAQWATTEGWRRVSTFSPAHFGAPKPTTGPPQLANRLVVVVAEGLRYEDAFYLPSLDRLVRQGAAYRLSVPAPVYPWSATATLLTGAPPTVHGVLLPTPGRSLKADHLPAVARRVNVSAGGVGTPILASLLGPDGTTWRTAGTSEARVEMVRKLLEPTGPRLVVIQLDDLHAASHRIGKADREVEEYKETLAKLDAEMLQILEQIDLKTSAVMVAGNVPTDLSGGHPLEGQVPLIIAGAGVKEGVRGEASLVDVASTMAALLGTPAPFQNQGRPLLEALRVEGRPADVISQRTLAVRKALSDAQLLTIGAREEVPEVPNTLQEAPGYIKAVEAQLKAAKFTAWKHGLMPALLYVGGALLVLLLYLLIAYRQPYGGALLMGTLTYGAAFHLVFYLSGGRYSAAMAGLETFDRNLAAGIGMRAALAMCVACIVSGLLLSRRRFKKRGYLASASLHMALSTAVAITLPLVVTLVFTGWEFPLELPGPGLIVWFFTTALQVVVIGYMSPIWTALTVTSARVGQRFWPVKELGDPEINADKVVRLRSLQRSARARAKTSRG